MAQERLQKVVARAGIASRRAAENLIVQGRVRVNGSIVSALGTKVDPRSDKVEVDGRRLVAEAPVYLVLHKPRGVVSTVSDPEGRSTVRDLVRGIPERVFPVGRLDYHTSGVLLLTNDGAFMDALLHPKREVPKTYVAKVRGEMTRGTLERWEEGVLVDGETMRAAEASVLRREKGKTWIEVTLYQGRNQQIRKMAEATGFPVMRLARVSFAGIGSQGLRPGQFRPLSANELIDLRRAFGVPKRVTRPREPSESGRTMSAPKRVSSRHAGRRRLTSAPPASTRRTGG